MINLALFPQQHKGSVKSLKQWLRRALRPVRSLILSGFYNLKILFKATLCQFLPYNFSKTWKLDLITFWVLALNLFLHCCRFFKTMPSTSSNLLNLNQDHPSKNLLRHEGFFASSVSSAKKAHLEYCK